MTAFYKYLPVDGAELFTVVSLPDGNGKFPTVICRNPYVDAFENKTEDEAMADYLKENKALLENGFAVVNQHCRGRGKSSGDCIPYIHEREDGLSLHEWIRGEDFYNGELYKRNYC